MWRLHGTVQHRFLVLEISRVGDLRIDVERLQKRRAGRL
jgi:hypothetical protein